MRQLQARQRSLFCQSSNHRFSQELAVASRILDQHPDFNRWVYDDLGGGNSKVDTGVRGMTAEQVLNHLLPVLAGLKPGIICEVVHTSDPK